MTSGRKGTPSQQEPLFIGGRYNKYSRTVSQTPWFIDGNKKVADSVEDFIKDGIKLFIPHSKSKFSASGREDVDVRMLGNGRPFVLEINDFEGKKDEVTAELLSKCQSMVNELSKGRVTVRDLQLVNRTQVNLFQKEDDLEKQKEYSALCCIDKPLSLEDMNRINKSFVTMKIQQKTPIRVLHRRPLATRERSIYSLEVLPHEPKDETSEVLPQLFHKFTLRVTTESGAYIKELVHGDIGRTRPSLADLIGGDRKTDIISLDVEQVIVDWPPKTAND